MINIPKLTSLKTERELRGNKPQTTKPKVKAKIGEKKYRKMLTWLGITISLENSFIPSAKGCNKPYIPTTLGPFRL